MGICSSRSAPTANQMAPAGGAPAGPAPPRLKSLSSRVSTFILFRNCTGRSVRLFWINYEGKRVPYRTIAPGGEYRQQTFCTHPWTFQLLPGPGPDPSWPADAELVVADHRRVVLPQPEETDVRLVRPEEVQWSPETHAGFDAGFKAMTKALLLSYHRLQAESPPPPPCAAESRPSSRSGRQHNMVTRAMGRHQRQRSAEPPAGFSPSPSGACPEEPVTMGQLPADLVLFTLSLCAPTRYLILPDPRNVDHGEEASSDEGDQQEVPQLHMGGMGFGVDDGAATDTDGSEGMEGSDGGWDGDEPQMGLWGMAVENTQEMADALPANP